MIALTARISALSQQIIDHEVGDRRTPVEVAHGIESAFARLHELMETIVGHLGFGAVLTRAIHLTRSEYPEAAELSAGSTFPIEGVSKVIERHGAASVRMCAVKLLANVMGLLGSFIGEDLTFRVVRRGWPELLETAGPSSEYP